jgi:2-keto-4-pentenoate hydratase
LEYRKGRPSLIEDSAIADEILATLRTGRQITPLTARYSDFQIADGYRIARTICDLRAARGEAGRSQNRFHRPQRLAEV